MTDFTPGPWFHRECSATTEHDWSVLSGIPTDGVNKVIADVCVRRVDEEEDQANARLISAAPDLLAACRVAQPLIAAFKDDDCMWACFTQLTAAIYKALGHD